MNALATAGIPAPRLSLVTLPTPRLARANDMAVVWAADDAGLSQSEHRLFSRIYRRFNARRGCDESLPKMAAGCKMHEDTARTALKALEARGMVRVTERNGQSKRIDVMDPEGWSDGAEQATPPRKQGGTSDSPPRNEGTGTPPKSGGTKYSPEADPSPTPRAKRAEEGGYWSDPPTDPLFDHPAVSAFAAASGEPPALNFAERIRHAVGDKPDDLALWQTDVLDVWRATQSPTFTGTRRSWANVPAILDAFGKAKAKRANPDPFGAPRPVKRGTMQSLTDLLPPERPN